MTWRGETDVATYTMIGEAWGNSNWQSEPSMMFDGKMDEITERNMYHSKPTHNGEYGLDYPGMKINFAEPVEFVDLRIVTRTGCCRDRYNDVCLYADNVKIGCTPSDLIDPGDLVNFKDYTAARTFAQEFWLNWENGEHMQIVELYFDYKGLY